MIGKEIEEKKRMGTETKYLLDTNVILEAFWGKKRVADKVGEWIESGKIVISVVCMAEILSKSSKKEEEMLRMLIKKFGVLEINQEIAELAGKYRFEFLRKKKRVYLLDCFIAATAKLHGLTLVTRNVKDYPMKDIKVLNPSKD